MMKLTSHPVLRSPFRILGLVALTAMTLVGYQNCGNDFAATSARLSSYGVGSGTCESELIEPFKNSFQPLLTTNCRACHVPGGLGKGAFASPDASIAFQDFLFASADKIAFNATSASHAPGITGPTLQSQVDVAKQTWDTAVADCKSGVDGLDSGSGATVPKPMEATTANKTITWNLDTELASGAGAYGGAKFSIQVRMATNASGVTTYYLTNPTVTTGTSALQIGQLTVSINGQAQPLATTFSRLDAEVPANTSNSRLSASTMIIESPVKPTDTLKISFGILKTK